MPVTTTSAAIHITPVVVKTFIKHAKRKGIKYKDGDTTVQGWDDILYDEAFHIVKAFIELGTKNTVESLQAFTNTHVPAPFWCAVVPVKIPLSSCNKAADVLIDWFGPDDLKHVVGGERWWQIRGLEWIDAEWITEKAYLKEAEHADRDKLTSDEKTIVDMEHLDRVMLYVHGGAFFWGSINTHRYQVIRYARKMHGRAFTVNYRKAPQYPWPCPLQDVLAAYFYLTNPPPGAVHQPVHPSKLVFAGDSAGASLCLTALTVLRDLGIPQPAGAVLISPWVDLTHSFPSVMTNASTDIIPPHGFIHKPSPLWPVHPKGEDGYIRVVKTRTNPPPQPGHADKLKPDNAELHSQLREREKQAADTGRDVHSADLQEPPEEIPSQKEMQQQANEEDLPSSSGGDKHGSPGSRSSTRDEQVHPGDDNPSGDGEANFDYESEMDYWEPKPPKVLMEDPNATPLELRAQIQLYATTEQLSHPLVSPILQSSLGNLCPLYIIAGDGECLRDEIIYLAHKAAHPKDYPARQGVLREGRRQKENAEKFQVPTKVHLQVFDDMCHVLTVFTFTECAQYAYRAIAQFAKHVIDNSSEHLSRNPFPELHRPPSEISDAESEHEHAGSRRRSHHKKSHFSSKRPRNPSRSVESGDDRTDAELYRLNEATAEREVKEGKAEKVDSGASSETVHDDNSEDIRAIGFIRERVDVLGKVRPMEPPKEIEALRLKPQEIGVIKEAPVRRWLEGQEEWDRRYKRTAEHVIRKRRQYEAKATRLLEHAREQGLIHDELQPQQSRASVGGSISSGSVGEIDSNRRWGPLDLKDENPPPSAIAGRRDTSEAVALLKKTIYHNAPATHRNVPKLKTSDAFRAVFEANDHPTKPPQQSVSEQQVHPQMAPMHGLRMWQSLVELFMRKSRKGVQRGKQHASSALQSTGDKISTVGKSRSNSNPSTNSAK
ncbi:alpha/beta-hydrolase [Trametes coccinea BRFM310]|uniref:Alpha/beta-hydrolase n=1 Tax=Trametes coccinea (strain BRFM310) TaxID=1353009 RepID=A0A1Y2IEN2_TRAC3|nr:alpha/beta-hydrolase [Trametes coccinea BRFM310]